MQRAKASSPDENIRPNGSSSAVQLLERTVGSNATTASAHSTASTVTEERGTELDSAVSTLLAVAGHSPSVEHKPQSEAEGGNGMEASEETLSNRIGTSEGAIEPEIESEMQVENSPEEASKVTAKSVSLNATEGKAKPSKKRARPAADSSEEKKPKGSAEGLGEKLSKARAVFESSKHLRLHYRGYHLKYVVPEVLVGRRVRIYWPDDQCWYSGKLTSYNLETGQHTVRSDFSSAHHRVV
eukprot:8304118-Pyramimonas_sp.AAC.1